MDRFSGKVVIVTGAGSGIGAATAQRFHTEGGIVVLAGRRREKLEAVAALLDADRTLVHQTDVSNEGQVTSLVAETVRMFGRLDVMVNNAGIAVAGKFLESTLAEWHAIMSTNVDGVFFGCRAAIPELLKTKGSIINVSSVSGMGGDWGLGAYNASKGAITNFTRSLALEFGGKGIRINAVSPGLTYSEMADELAHNEVLFAKFAERIPLARVAEAAEVASVIAFLASNDASYVNGVNLPVDGGLTASNGQPNVFGA